VVYFRIFGQGHHPRFDIEENKRGKMSGENGMEWGTVGKIEERGGRLKWIDST